MKKIPVELYITLLPCILIVPLLSICSGSFRGVIVKTVSYDIINAMFFNNRLFDWGIRILLLVAACAVTNRYIHVHKAKKQNANWDDKKYRHKILEYLIILAMIAATTIMSGSFLIWFFRNAHANKIIKACRLLMDWDWKLFGVYPPFWIHKFQNIPGLEPFLIWSYRNLNIIASAAFVLLLLNTKFLKRFILTIYVATMMSFPIWVSVPAISPIGMYVNNNLKASVPKDIATYIKSYPVTVRLAVDSTIIDATFTGLGRYPISTFPSMHAAWAFIIGCFVFKLRPPAIIVFLPFLIGTTLGAVYVAQHYSVDIMAGFLIAALAMLITGYIEKKYAEKECRDIGVGPNVVNLRKMVRKRA